MSSFISSNAFAHTEVNIENYIVDIGWGDEPPVVGFRNFIIIKITQENDGVVTGVVDAFQNMDAFARSGGTSKELDIVASSENGIYTSKIIPTKTGTIAIKLQGDLSGTLFDVQIPVEDVESSTVLEFPLTEGSSSEQDMSSLKNSLNSLQSDVLEIKSAISGVNIGDNQFDSNTAFNFGVIGMATGIAGTILAIFSFLKRK